MGDKVLAYNAATGQTDEYPITAVLVHTDAVITDLTIDGEPIETTPQHPFYTQERGWVDAGDLQVGEHIRTADWDYGTVESVKNVQQTQPMYNLTVDEAHTFFVGDGQWLVHNVQCDLEFLTNIADDPLEQNQAVLERYQEGKAGFSGVYDPKNEVFLARPSDSPNPNVPRGTLFKDGTPPEYTVSNQGGHDAVNSELAQIGGIDTSKTVGFVIVYDGPNSLELRWNSLSVNATNYGNRTALPEYQKAITDLIKSVTGFNVWSKPG